MGVGRGVRCELRKWLSLTNIIEACHPISSVLIELFCSIITYSRTPSRDSKWLSKGQKRRRLSHQFCDQACKLLEIISIGQVKVGGCLSSHGSREALALDYYRVLLYPSPFRRASNPRCPPSASRSQYRVKNLSIAKATTRSPAETQAIESRRQKPKSSGTFRESQRAVILYKVRKSPETDFGYLTIGKIVANTLISSESGVA